MPIIISLRRKNYSHERIKRIIEIVSCNLSNNPDVLPSGIKLVPHLSIQVDGGHGASLEQDKRSFEMVTTVLFDGKISDIGVKRK